ncbi:MAG: hypothetical protein JXK05_10790 [Campylobacterales bacterium]|nr:hypothetical protein [Campylobacterales bacterium]
MTISSNLSSIQNSQYAMNQSAQRVAQAGRDPSQTDLSKELTDQMMIEKSVQSNASVIKTADEMLGSLLDTKA